MLLLLFLILLLLLLMVLVLFSDTAAPVYQLLSLRCFLTLVLRCIRLRPGHSSKDCSLPNISATLSKQG